MTCDHVASKASMRVFLASTTRHVIQQLDDGAPLLMGNCKGCNSTIAVEIDLARGSIVRGEIETPPRNHCPLHEWCFQEPGHKGDCILPF